MSSQGIATIDFGAHPGSSEATVNVTGQTGITSASAAEAWLMADTTSDHTPNDHAYAALFARVTCSVPTDDVGFTITATATEKLTGTFKVRWVWN